VVELPEWFDKLNHDFCYQLTPIGAPAPDLHIAGKIRRSRFEIAGGVPHTEVSWQVTGIRNDPWARAHPLVVEEKKARSSRNLFLHPELYGKPRSKGFRAPAIASKPRPQKRAKKKKGDQTRQILAAFIRG